MPLENNNAHGPEKQDGFEKFKPLIPKYPLKH